MRKPKKDECPVAWATGRREPGAQRVEPLGARASEDAGGRVAGVQRARTAERAVRSQAARALPLGVVEPARNGRGRAPGPRSAGPRRWGLRTGTPAPVHLPAT